MTSVFAIRSRHAVVGEDVTPALLVVRDGRIEAVRPWEEVPTGILLVDVGDDALLPGIVDTHVHVNQPGRTEWEGFRTATRAAATGGITTLVDMPLNSIPATVTKDALVAKRREAEGNISIDVGFWGGVIPSNRGQLGPMAEAGALGFKCFLVESGVDEFPYVTPSDLDPAFEELAHVGRPLLVHAEVEGPIARASGRLKDADPRKYSTYLESRPPEAEEQAIALVLDAYHRNPCRVHIVHHSAASALDLLRNARAQGAQLTAETCPHYLHFKAESIADGATPFKCAPPIREAANREALWRALEEGVLDLIASDHSPCTPALKKQEQGDFAAAWGGISGLQISLSVIWTEARARGFGLGHLSRWMCQGPARLAGLTARKGALRVGCDADFTVFAPDESFVVEPNRIEHRHKVTPYAGETLFGVVRATYVRGNKVFDASQGIDEGQGRQL